MAIRRTHEEFIKIANQKNPNIRILGRYINAQEKIRCYCIKHSYEWDGYPTSILNGCGCKYCKSEKIKKALSLSKEDFVSRISDSIEVIGEYVNNSTPILLRCKKCGHEWYALPSNSLKGYGCPVCSKRYKDNDIFLAELSKITKDIIPLEEYKGAHVKILCHCKICGRNFYITPNKLLMHRGCPFCKRSKGEKAIKNFLDKNKISNIPQITFNDLRGVNNGLLSYDFYLCDYNMLIEFQGQFHDGTARLQKIDELEVQQEHDKRKREYAKSHKIDLLEIWYYDIDKIEEILSKKLNINIAA